MHSLSTTAVLVRLSAAFTFVVVWSSWWSTANAAGESDQHGGWPLSPIPEVVHPFDPPAVPWASGHRGVDLAARLGQPVLSPERAVVGFTGVIAGVPVVVLHSSGSDVGHRTTYQPVLASVPTGTPLAPGAVIGHVSGLGSHCAPRPCLHWGLIRAGDTTNPVYLDPLSLVATRRIRLLPLW